MIQGVSIDSRTVKTSNLFIPIIRQLDGHEYVEEAISKGAIASLWQKDHPNPPDHLPLIYVDDCLKALQNLATNYRRELSIKVIGVTGSNGKTTTKDMINSVVQTKYRVHKTLGNLNSQIGVPLTILEIDKNSEVAVIEMGMSERGQIDRLSRIAQPDVAVITMIGVSHLSSLGSREDIAAAKLEIVNGLQDNGILIYNGPNSMTAAIKTFEELTGYARKFLVLGDMLELGEQEQEFHRDIGRNINPTKIDFIYTVGTLGKHIALEAEENFHSGRVQSFQDKEELTKDLRKMVKKDDVILLKGSRGMQLETIMQDLL